jgi:hypothetical protein
MASISMLLKAIEPIISGAGIGSPLWTLNFLFLRLLAKVVAMITVARSMNTIVLTITV